MERTLSCALLALLAACVGEPRGELLVLSGPSMGTSWSVKVAGLPADVDSAALETELAAILGAVDERMSTYRPDSELSRFNRSRSTDWFPVSADTAAVVVAALAISERTGGAFDVTVGPLVNLWGFGPEPWPARVPTEEELRAARASTGSSRLAARAAPPAIRMQAAERHVDLSAIAKGFAVDALAEHLEARGIPSYLVELGGELRAGERRPSGEHWTVGVERPGGGRTAVRTLALERCAVATSGDYRNFRVIDGERAPHVLDPRSGRPIRTGVGSATVVCASAMEADALATALMVLGPEEGLRFAEREGLAAQLVVRAEGALVVRSTPSFEALLADAPESTPIRRFLAALVVMLLAMAGLAAGLLVRGRALRAGCGGERASATPSLDCPACPEPCPATPDAADPLRAHHPHRHAREA